MEELHESIKWEIKQDTPQNKINWGKLQVHAEESDLKLKKRLAKKKGKNYKAEEASKDKSQNVAMLYKKNPLFTRFLYQIAFMSGVIGFVWFYFPLTMNKSSTGNFFCLAPETAILPDFDCLSF